jgi:hypothetical protein
MTISTSMSGTNLDFYTLFTLVDITNTGITNSNFGGDLARDQQRNWETVLQTIGLRAQPVDTEGPAIFDVGDIGLFEFGEMFQQKQKVWTMSFGVEHRDVFKSDNDPTASLCEDFNQVPIITGLTETAHFMLPIFYTSGAIKNIYFKTGRLELNIR